NWTRFARRGFGGRDRLRAGLGGGLGGRLNVCLRRLLLGDRGGLLGRRRLLDGRGRPLAAGRGARLLRGRREQPLAALPGPLPARRAPGFLAALGPLGVGRFLFLLDLLGRLLGEGDDVVGRLLAHPRQFPQLGRLEERQVVVGEEPLLDERLDHLV